MLFRRVRNRPYQGNGNGLMIVEDKEAGSHPLAIGDTRTFWLPAPLPELQTAERHIRSHVIPVVIQAVDIASCPPDIAQGGVMDSITILVNGYTVGEGVGDQSVGLVRGDVGI